VVGKPEERRQFATPRCRCQYNIKIGHEYILWGVDGIHLAEDTLKWRGLMMTVINLSVPFNASEMLDYFGNNKISFTRRTLQAS
jgi:hypothetical protein